MKEPQTLAVVFMLFCGCASKSPSRNAVMPYAPLTRPLDDFCRSPDPGTFALPRNAASSWDVIVADTQGVRLGWTRVGAVQPSTGPLFRSKLPGMDEMVALPLGAAESEIVDQLGEPSRTWYDLYPVIDSVVPVTRIFGRDTKYCDYQFFSTTPASDIVQTAIWLSYTKNASGRWLLAKVRWKMEGDKESGSELDGAANRSQPIRSERNRTSSAAGSGR
jgi:hypothetical protein